MNVDQLRETALVNFELLLNHWKLTYRQVLPDEYDLIASWRQDKSFGSVRFNTKKGRGADFAARNLQEEDFFRLGSGFDKSDFIGFSNGEAASKGFDIIGLCQRVFHKNTGKEAAEQLKRSLDEISTSTTIRYATLAEINRRKQEIYEREQRTRNHAKDLWESCKYHKFEGSVGEHYLKITRGIDARDDNVRFHPGINHSPTKTKYPALIFKVQSDPEGPLKAIHRIYLDNSGNKAKLDNPKMALAPIRGNAIWFGSTYNVLAITEGPENALSLRDIGFRFVVSSVYGTNLHNITIPLYVNKLYIAPDVDPPGMEAFERAMLVYSKLKIQVKPFLIDKMLREDGKIMDINDQVKEGIIPKKI